MASVIREYLDKHVLAVKDFAKRAGLTNQTVHNILKGGKVRRLSAAKMSRATKGEIKISDFGFEK